jgi:dihydrofolate synthase / folylpolyglutamate synthase
MDRLSYKMDIETSLKKLYSLHTFGMKLGLDNIKDFLQYIENPQLTLKCFHLAGSNGKGSTAAFAASMLMEAGYKVGLYTSPHFIKFNERITINNKEIPDKFVAKFVSDYNDIIDKKGLTFFEVTTAMAFKYFAEKKVDYAVIETGLGGRLDATNVLNPLAVIITSISLEHTNILGSKISQIACEKAAIIKERTKVFTGFLPPEADSIISEKCNVTESELYMLEEYLTEKAIRPDGATILYTEELELEFDDQLIPLRGDFQKHNAALAALAVSKILDFDNEKILINGIKNVLKNTNIKGRYEFYNHKPDIIFDSAHNPAGIKSFLSEFKKDLKLYDKKLLLFAVMKDKSIKEMLTLLKDYFDEIHITEIEYERCCSISELSEIAKSISISVIYEKDYLKFIKNFKNEKERNCLVVLGSMYLLGEVKININRENFA